MKGILSNKNFITIDTVKQTSTRRDKKYAALMMFVLGRGNSRFKT
jgi:hypothetical protein